MTPPLDPNTHPAVVAWLAANMAKARAKAVGPCKRRGDAAYYRALRAKGIGRRDKPKPDQP